jgi:hypothetical protein
MRSAEEGVVDTLVPLRQMLEDIRAGPPARPGEKMVEFFQRFVESALIDMSA